VVEGFLRAVDNQVAKVDVAVVGNNSTRHLEAEATDGGGGDTGGRGRGR
jgi:hypothetical protein